MSPLGNVPEEIWTNYCSSKSLIVSKEMNNQKLFMAPIQQEYKFEIELLKQSDNKYNSLDETVLMAILVSRNAIKKAGWSNQDSFGINIGSSRGATKLFEKYHQEYLETGKTATLASPTTTLGNISSWVAHDLKNQGVAISHSITCSTALHAVLNAVAWLNSGMANKFLVGGSEASLTGFTLAQMQALKIYANSSEPNDYPCRAFDLEKTKNSMVLGEAAVVACLENGSSPNAIGYIEGIGFATDDIEHNISISSEANCFQKSMKMALQNTPLKSVDAIVMHAPGTIKGDSSEFKAIQKIFGERLPLLTTNKWKVGHTFGASGMLNIELALMMMQYNQFIDVPYLTAQKQERNIKKVIVNAVGFGGNAVSILLSLD